MILDNFQMWQQMQNQIYEKNTCISVSLAMVNGARKWNN